MRTKKCVCGVILFLQKWINMFVFLWRLCKYINVFVFHLLSDVSCLMCSFNYCINRENAMRFNSFFKRVQQNLSFCWFQSDHFVWRNVDVFLVKKRPNRNSLVSDLVRKWSHCTFTTQELIPVIEVIQQLSRMLI